MKYNYISNIKIKNNFNIEIEFDNKYKHIYYGISDFCFNKSIDDNYPYDIIDYFSNIVSDNDYKIINNIFGIKYDKNFFEKEIKGKMNFLQIEGSLTLYMLYKKEK